MRDLGEMDQTVDAAIELYEDTEFRDLEDWDFDDVIELVGARELSPWILFETFDGE